MTLFKRPPPEGIRLLRKSFAGGLWLGAFLACTQCAIFASRSPNPDAAFRYTVVAAAVSLILGSVGYLLWSGMILKDEAPPGPGPQA